MSCVKEKATCHYLGSGHGHGPIRPQEIVAFAVFQSVPVADGKVAPTAFKSDQLRDGDFSLARLTYTTRETFDEKVVAPKMESDSLVGVVACRTSDLQDLYFPFPENSKSPMKLRVICVLDKVEPGDHDGHAALQYCEEQQTQITNPKTRGKIRSAQIAVMLADAFGSIQSVETVFPT